MDLDAPAKERFKHVVRPYKDDIQAVFDVLGVGSSLYSKPHIHTPITCSEDAPQGVLERNRIL